jgi:F5/8 type C domain
MGKSSKPTIGYRHYMGLYMGESLPNDYLSAIDVGGEIAFEGEFSGSGTININKPMLFGGDKKEGGIVGTLTIRQGEATQMPDPYLQSQVAGPWPAGRGLCTTIYNGQVGAMNPYIKLWKKRWGAFFAGWTTPVWQPTLLKIGRGKNPMHILYQCFTDLEWGIGFSTTQIDEASFLAAAQTLHSESFSLCLPYRRSTAIGEYIEIINNHIGGQWATDPRTGKITYRLFRDDYDVATLPLIDESNIVKMESWQTALLDSGTNEVTVVGRDPVTNKDISATYQNPANVQAQGRVIAAKKQFPGLWNDDLLTRVAARETIAASALLSRIKVTVKRDLWGVKRGDVLAISWARKGIVRMPVRVLEVDEGTRTDSKIGLLLVQDISGMSQTSYVKPSVSMWVPPDTTPKPVAAQRVYEASYRDLSGYLRPADLAILSGDAGYVVALGARPAGVSYNFVIESRTGAAEFQEVGSGDFSATGLLATALSLTSTAITLTTARDLDLVKVGTEIIIGTEHCRVDAINATTATATIARGCVDTVPVSHSAGTRVWFSDIYLGADSTEYLDGETVDLKLLSRTQRGTLDPALATTASVTLDQRQYRPYPPGQLRINGAAYPASITGPLVVSWAHRHRLLQADQLVDTQGGSIGPEAGTTYTVRLYDQTGTLRRTAVGVTGTSYTWDNESIDSGLGGYNEVVTGLTWSQSSAFSAGLTATTTNMRDGINTTGAATQNGVQWIKVDLGAAKNVARIAVAGGTLSGWGGVAAFLNGRLIQYSTDNATWTTVATIAGVNDTGTLFNFDFTAVSARYWRLSSTAWLSTTEMRVYEGAVGALNSRVRVRVESVRGGLASMQSHDYTVPRV